MEIRTFTMADHAAVAALWERAGLLPSRSDAPDEIAKKLARDPELFLVGVEGAGDAGTIVGAVMGAFDGRRGWIYHLAVDPQRQSRGLGAMLLRELEARFRAAGCLKVNLLIEMDNAAVAGFYRHHGYATDPLVFMEKWLG